MSSRIQSTPPRSHSPLLVRIQSDVSANRSVIVVSPASTCRAVVWTARCTLTTASESSAGLLWAQGSCRSGLVRRGSADDRRERHQDDSRHCRTWESPLE